ncbi:MAG: signal peptidase II [Clostridia bacterium]|nr:signal peptidase II [Clostridia bacterium]
MIYAIIFFASILLDQITKAIVDMNDYNITVIKGIFSIDNIRNDGAAFSMFGDKPWAQTFFIVLTVVALLGLAVYVIFKKDNSRWLNVSLALIASGAIGNFIDRLAFKEVRDFLFVHFFANFNVADIAITVGGIMLVFYFLFLDKDAIFKKKENPNGNQ